MPTSTIPPSDVLSKPQPDSAVAQIDDWLREVAMSPQVGRHAVVVREPQDLCDLGGPDQILGVDPW